MSNPKSKAESTYAQAALHTIRTRKVTNPKSVDYWLEHNCYKVGYVEPANIAHILKRDPSYK